MVDWAVARNTTKRLQEYCKSLSTPLAFPAFGEGGELWCVPGIRAAGVWCLLLCDLRRVVGGLRVGVSYAECMTPEITDPAVRAIAEEIAADPANASYTKRGIEPLFFAGPQCRIMIVGSPN